MKKTDTDSTLAHDLVDLVSLIKAIARKELKGTHKGRAITLTQLRILLHIKNGVNHVGKLSDLFGISQPATSIMVNLLVREGLVIKVPHTADRRQVELRLTPRANADIKTGYKRAYSTINEKLSPLSKTKKQALAMQVRELTRLLSCEKN